MLTCAYEKKYFKQHQDIYVDGFSGILRFGMSTMNTHFREQGTCSNEL